MYVNRLLMYVRSLLLIVAALLAPCVYGQAAEETPWHGAVAAGRAAVQAGAPARAVQLLEPVVAAVPGWHTAAEGAAAYWLGRAYEASGRPERALAAWQAGLAALHRAGTVDRPLVDAYVDAVFTRQRRGRYGLAAEAYLALLESLDGTVPPEDRAIWLRHLEPLASVLPERLRVQTGLAAVASGQPMRTAPGAGQALAAWWRRRDVLPATTRHEPLETYLERVAYARAHYARPDGTGLDDRGRVYVRLGAPEEQVAVTFTRHEVVAALPEIVSQLPEAVFWVYRALHPDAQYLFVRPRGEAFRLGEVADLVPRALRVGAGHATRRAAGRADALLLLLADVYGQLAHLHPAYGARYAEVLQEVQMREMNAWTGTRPGGARHPTATVTAEVVARGVAEDARAGARRAANVPHFHTGLLDTLDALPVSVRWARFLDPDGTTRTEVYWGLPAAGLAPSPRRARRRARPGVEPADLYLLTCTAVRQAPDYRPDPRPGGRQVAHRLLPADAGLDEEVPAQTLTFSGDTAAYHLALQWDLHGASLPEAGGEAVTRGALLKVATLRRDSLAALHAAPDVLEMSDLKPVRVEGAATPGRPYPYAVIGPGDALALYFEIYHLQRAADGQVHYTVAYDVARRAPGSGPDEHARRISARTTGAGGNPRQEEYIFMDLAPWRGTGALQVTVQVTDETTGRQVERSIHFDLAPPP